MNRMRYVQSWKYIEWNVYKERRYIQNGISTKREIYRMECVQSEKYTEWYVYRARNI